MADEVIVDALPYIDQGYEDAGVREAALALVDEETRSFRPTKNYLEHLPPLNITSFETDIMKTEMDRLQQRQPMEMLSMKRYELPPPPPGKLTDLAAWKECVDNSMAQLQHQAVRVENLELMLEYGCDTWRMFLDSVSKQVAQGQKLLQTYRKQIQEVNWERKSAQTASGDKLRTLEASWINLVSKNYEIELACVELEKQILSLPERQSEPKPKHQKREYY